MLGWRSACTKACCRVASKCSAPLTPHFMALKPQDCSPAGSPPQFVREGGTPTKAVFSELEPGNRQEIHSAPSVRQVHVSLCSASHARRCVRHCCAHVTISGAALTVRTWQSICPAVPGAGAVRGVPRRVMVCGDHRWRPQGLQSRRGAVPGECWPLSWPQFDMPSAVRCGPLFTLDVARALHWIVKAVMQGALSESGPQQPCRCCAWCTALPG